MVASPRKPKTAKSADASFISNPFRVLTTSFRAVFMLNLSRLVGLMAVGLGGIVVLVLIAIVIRLNFSDQIYGGTVILLIALGAVLALILLTGFAQYSLETARGRAIGTRQLLQTGYTRAVGYLAVTGLNALIVAVGLVLLVVPGLVFLYWFYLAPYVYLDQKLSPVESLKASRQLVRGRAIEFWGLVAANGLFAIPGYLPIIGLFYQFFFSAASNVGWAYRYLSLQKASSKNRVLPPIDKTNRWAIVILAGLILAVAGGFVASGNSRDLIKLID